MLSAAAHAHAPALQDNDFAGDGQKITLDECVEYTKGM